MKCAICNQPTVDEPFDICNVCGWEHEDVLFPWEHSDMNGGVTILKARRAYKRNGNAFNFDGIDNNRDEELDAYLYDLLWDRAYVGGSDSADEHIEVLTKRLKEKYGG